MALSSLPDADELRAFLTAYPGVVAAAQPVPTGLVDTWRIATESGPRLLSLFTEDAAAAAEQGAARLGRLREAGVPAASPLADRTGHLIGRLGAFPAMLLLPPPGECLPEFAAVHCAAVGEALAGLHRLPADADAAPRPGVREQAQALLPTLPAEDAGLVQDELRFQGLYRLNDLPRGLVHGKPMRAALFEGERLGGLLGLERAGEDVLLRDLAAAAVEGCTSSGGALDPSRVLALLEAYHALRRLKPIERGAWPVALRGEALRRWLDALESGAADQAQSAKTLLLACREGERELARLWP